MPYRQVADELARQGMIADEAAAAAAARDPHGKARGSLLWARRKGAFCVRRKAPGSVVARLPDGVFECVVRLL